MCGVPVQVRASPCVFASAVTQIKTESRTEMAAAVNSINCMCVCVRVRACVRACVQAYCSLRPQRVIAARCVLVPTAGDLSELVTAYKWVCNSFFFFFFFFFFDVVTLGYLVHVLVRGRMLPRSERHGS